MSHASFKQREDILKNRCWIIPLLLILLLTGCAVKNEKLEPETAAVAVEATPVPEPEKTEPPAVTEIPEEKATEIPKDEQEATEEPETVFSVVWITDTQKLAYEENGYLKLSDWCLENREEKNIRYIFGTGDYVETFKMEYQWQEFLKFRDTIDGKIPWIFVAGNHDIKLYDMTYDTFTDHVYGENGAAEQEYNKGQGKYELFSAGGIDWIVIGVSFGYGKEEAVWVSEVLDRYPERKAILLFHDYLYKDGGLIRNAKPMFSDSVMSHTNVRLILCGHNAGYIVRTDPLEDGGFVQTLFCNKQNQTKQTGSIQLLTFDTEKQQVELDYFSLLSDQSEMIHDLIPLDLH